METKAKSTGSPWLSWGNQPAEASENSPSLPHPALCGPGFHPTGLKFLLSAFSAGGQVETQRRNRKDPSCPYPYPRHPCQVPFAGHCGWGEGKKGRPWPPLMSWHRWQSCRVRSTEMLCLIWNSECISIKEGHKLYLACIGPTGQNYVIPQEVWS